MQNNEVEAWLVIAKEDLAAARGLLKLELFSTATYHCQQATEKALKAYLVFKKQTPSKTHDLLRLIELCMRFDKDFEEKKLKAVYLNTFATRFRYPTEYDIPDKSDTAIAVNYAKAFMDFVLDKMEAQETGQTDLFKPE